MSDAIKEILNNEKKLREIVKVSFDNVITDRSSQIDQNELEKLMVKYHKICMLNLQLKKMLKKL